MQFSSIGSLFIYFGIYILSSYFLDSCAKSQNMVNKKIFYIIAMFLVVFLATIRYNVGTDYITYAQIYESTANLSFVEWIMDLKLSSTPVAVFLFSKIAYCFDSMNVFFMLFAIAIYIPVSLEILRHKDSASVFIMSFAFLTTTFTTGLNIMKQIAACAFVLVSIRFIFERKPIEFVLMIICAFCFHPTALIAAPLYIVGDKQEKNRVSRCRLIFCGICYVVVCVLYRKILSLFGGRFEDYLNSSAQGNNYSFMLSLVILLGLMLFREPLLKNHERNLLYLFLMALGVMLEFFGYISPFIKRIALYFSMVSILLIPQISRIFGENDKVIIDILLFMYYIAMFIVSFCVLGQANIIPFEVR